MQRRGRRRAIAKAKVAFDPSTASGTFLLVGIGAALFAATNIVPAQLLLPVLAIASVAVAGAVFLLGWWLGVPRDRNEPTLWDIAGGCLLIGIGAGVFSDSDRATQAIASLLH